MLLKYSPFRITKNFHSSEFDCKNVYKNAVPYEYLMNVIYLACVLQKIVDLCKLDYLRINSGYRTPKYNEKVGGQPKSNHIIAAAADLNQNKYSPDKFYRIIREFINVGLLPNGELIKYESFVHYAPQYNYEFYPLKNNILYEDPNQERIHFRTNIDKEQREIAKKILEKF